MTHDDLALPHLCSVAIRLPVLLCLLLYEIEYQFLLDHFVSNSILLGLTVVFPA